MQKTINLLLGFIGFVVLTGPVQAASPINLPEYWGGSDWLGFLAVASIAFAMMIRLRVLKPRVGR
jgi:hypothetical protein